MKVLIVGSGGREHALAWKIAQSTSVEQIFCAPGNAGMGAHATCVDIESSDIDALRDFAHTHDVGLTVVGPELPLTLGIVDVFEDAGLRIFGPSKSAARLEGSKIFAKNIMRDAGIPTADYAVFGDPGQAKQYIYKRKAPLVVKADGLAAGKGVFPCRSITEAEAAVDRIMVQREFGDAGNEIVVEDFLEGEEASFIGVTDGTSVLALPSSQDHKPVFDGDTGPNTGGMGAYSPAPVITPEIHEYTMNTIMIPAVTALAAKGIPYKGFLYAGLMIKDNQPHVLEFNVRFGDPETQPILFRLENDLIDLLNASIDGRLSDVTVSCNPRPSVCIVMASGGYPGSYTTGLPIQGLDAAAGIQNTCVFHAGTAQKDGAMVTNGGRVLGVTSRGDTIKEAIDTAYRAVDTIHWPDVHYRKDIGRKALDR